MTFLTGEVFPSALLRFNYSSTLARHANARQGLRLYGPYDSGTFGRNTLNCGVIYTRGQERARDALINGLINGSGQFGGFQSLFRVSLSVTSERPIKRQTETEVVGAARSLAADNPDLVFMLVQGRNDAIYASAKAELLGNGIPNQIVNVPTVLNSRQIQWTLENIALACYAKVGGTPWVVASGSTKRELVIGISRAQDQAKRFIVGFVTLLTQDGDFLLMHSLSPRPLGWGQSNQDGLLQEYSESLSNLIVGAYQDYCREQGTPDSIVLHLCKRPGKFREIEAVERAMGRIGTTLPTALVHLNDDSTYRLFDSATATYVPQSGLKVELSRRESLLLLDGLVAGRRNRRGMPRVLDISMDKRSTIDVAEFPRLIRQICSFARVNWRGFNAQAVPATLNYSYLIARLVAEIGPDRWNAIVGAGRLRDKAWFL